jgi:hypothetical protein
VEGKFWISCLHCSTSLLSLEKEVPGKEGAKAAAAPQGPLFSTSFPSLGELAYRLHGRVDGECLG